MTIKTFVTYAPATALLIASFVGLFILQVADGASLSEPSGEMLVKWGANYLPLTLTHDPWRMITSAFLHIGFMHLLFNAFAMYFFGQVAERVFGSAKLLALFLLSAIGGNLLNLYDGVYWQMLSGGSLLSAGASGGVMGIGMALFTLELLRHTWLALNRTPDSMGASGSINKSIRHTSDTSLLKNLALIMAINLVYGFAISGIDNAGHIGGALTGGMLSVSFVLTNPNLNHRIALASTTATRAERSFTLLSAVPWITCLAVAVIFWVLWASLHNQVVV